MAAISLARLKVAIVGCGRIAHKHLQAIQANAASFELVACCDIDLAKAHALIDDSIAYYDDLATMLSEESLDIISLCTPSGLHATQAILGAKHGVHVISEKPMATTWLDGLAMQAAFQSGQNRLFVVKQNRLNPTVQQLKLAIDQGWFGRLYSLQANVFWTRPQAYYDQASWRGTHAMDGGALMNQASHYVDLLEWLAGPVSEVQAMAGTLARQIEAEDTIMLNLRWQQGTIGSMCVSMLTYPKNLEGSITILGEHGTAKLSGIALNQFETWQFANAAAPTRAEVNSANYETDSVYGSGHTPYYHNVADCLLNGAEPVADGEAGLHSLKLIVAAYNAAKHGKTVKLTQSFL